MRKPHVPQNRNDGGTSLPHDGQRRMPVAAGGAVTAAVGCGGAKPGEKPGTPGGGPIGRGPGPGLGFAPSGPEGGMPGIPRFCAPWFGFDGICCDEPRTGAPGTGACDGSAIIVFIIATSPPPAFGAVSSAPHPRQNL